jgi:hypothetical protein
MSPVLGVGDEHIAKALTRPVKWKIPNDYAAVRQMQNTATPLVLQDSPIAQKNPRDGMFHFRVTRAVGQKEGLQLEKFAARVIQQRVAPPKKFLALRG